jgi:(p)ppGpp synthase/HD superfamily hydrolase
MSKETKDKINERYAKLGIQLKGYLKGKGFHKALEAFTFAKEIHDGYRKDGMTPEFQHQIEICLFILTLKEVKDEENTLIAALLHDVREDYNIPHKVIEEKFGTIAADAVEKLTKVFNGNKKDTYDYFRVIAECPIASIVKLADRIHNISTMVGVFSIEKQEKYIEEVKEHFLPLVKIVRNRFPEQSLSYYNMGTFIKNMCRTIEEVIKAEKELLQHKAITPVTTSKPKM